MRNLVLASCCVFVSALLVGCSKSPEARMKACGVSGDSNSVLGISLGMSAEAARKLLKCYDKKASVETGQMGQFAVDANRLLMDRTGGTENYSNLLVWTRGQPRDCTGVEASDQSTTSAATKADDKRFPQLAFNLGRETSGWRCFQSIDDQISIIFGGSPANRVVVGVWRLNLPENGMRPPLPTVLSELKAKYPALDTAGLSDVGAGFRVWGFAARDGAVLNFDRVQEAYLAASPRTPTPPTPPKETRACGVLWLDACARDVPQSERDAYEAAKAQYERAQATFVSDTETYERTKSWGQKYYPCIETGPSLAGRLPYRNDIESACGKAWYVAVTSYPGGVAEAVFIGLYDQQLAERAAIELSEYLRTKAATATGKGASERSW